MLKNRVAGNRVSATMADAADLIETLSSSSCSSSSSASGMLDAIQAHQQSLPGATCLFEQPAQGPLPCCTNQILIGAEHWDIERHHRRHHLQDQSAGHIDLEEPAECLCMSGPVKSPKVPM